MTDPVAPTTPQICALGVEGCWSLHTIHFDTTGTAFHARSTPAEPLVCAACGGTDAPVVMVPLHPHCADTPAEALDDIAHLVKRHTHDEANVLIYDLRGPQKGCLLCRALVAAGVLTIDQIGADTAARLRSPEGD